MNARILACTVCRVENTGKSPVKRHDSIDKKRVQFEYKEHVEYKVYAISRGYEQRNDMNAHVIVLIEFAMSYCGYIPLIINYAGNSLFMEPYAKQS